MYLPHFSVFQEDLGLYLVAGGLSIGGPSRYDEGGDIYRCGTILGEPEGLEIQPLHGYPVPTLQGYRGVYGTLYNQFAGVVFSYSPLEDDVVS